MTKHPDLFTALAAAFEPSELKTREGAGKRQIHYVTARTVMNRLDNVLGPENWWDRYVPGENSVLCELTIRLPDGSTLTKCDAGGYAGMADSGDDDKSGYSDSFKRAAVKFGVARYLYRDGVPSFAAAAPDAGAHSAPIGESVPASSNGDGHHKQKHDWGAGRPPEAKAAQPTHERAADCPRTGKAFFAWTKEQEQRHSVGLLKYLNGWAKLQEFPGRMIDWDAQQVELAHAEATRKLKYIESQEVA